LLQIFIVKDINMDHLIIEETIATIAIRMVQINLNRTFLLLVNHLYTKIKTSTLITTTLYIKQWLFARNALSYILSCQSTWIQKTLIRYLKLARKLNKREKTQFCKWKRKNKSSCLCMGHKNQHNSTYTQMKMKNWYKWENIELWDWILVWLNW